MEFTTMGWVLVAVGFVPWWVKWASHSRRQGQRRQQWRALTLQAIFWQLTVERRPQRCRWQLTLPLIERCKTAIWAVLQDLVNG